jgi:hypothetical protein
MAIDCAEMRSSKIRAIRMSLIGIIIDMNGIYFDRNRCLIKW